MVYFGLAKQVVVELELTLDKDYLLVGFQEEKMTPKVEANKTLEKRVIKKFVEE